MTFRQIVPALLLAAASAQAGTRLASVFGDHMVLQQGQPVRIWGWDDAGAELTVKMGGKSAKAKADAAGLWKAELPAMVAGGPYELEAAGSSSVKISDVLVGELWVASGQSNMEFLLQNTHDAATEVPAANLPQLRHFLVEKATSDKAQDAVKGEWKVCTPANAGGFSAVAYHFGKNLNKKLKVPVGLIHASWGGTPGEVWTPREELEKVPALAATVKAWDADPSRKEAWTQGLEYDLQISDMKLVPKGGKGKGKAVEFKADNFTHNEKPGSSGNVEPKGKSARYWGRVMGGAWGSANLALNMGQPVDLTAYEALEFKAKGKSGFMISLGQPSVTDYDFHMSPEFSVGADEKTVRIELSSLKQGGWGKAVPFTQDQVSTVNFILKTPYWPESAGVCYNAMIAPLTGLSIRGAIWYQGESNVGRPKDYRALLGTLIPSWRKAFPSGDFPFLICQIPDYLDPCASPCESDWAQLRESQRLAAGDLKGVDFATLIGLGDAKDIHPKNKRDVGVRLASLALQDVYGSKTEGAGPRPLAAKFKGPSATVSFSRGGGLAEAPSGLEGFELAGEDGVFHLAKAGIQGNSVILSSEGLSVPKKVRYAWNHNPKPSLVGKNGFPATPFQVDIAP